MKKRFPAVGIIFFTAVLGASSHTAFAQHFDIGIDYLAGLPQNDFRTTIDRNSYGFAGHVGYFLGNTPIMIGADLGFLNYGMEKRREPFSNTMPDVTVDVRTSNNILMLHGFVRLQPQKGTVRPYVEGLLGFKYLFTRTSINNSSDHSGIASTTNFGDVASSWGGGAGVDLCVWKPAKSSMDNTGYSMVINLSARYLLGSEADYLKKGSIERHNDGTVSYTVLQSHTDMFIPQIGIHFRF